MPNNKIPCPYSNERLHEMYWHQAKSLSVIGRLAAVSYPTVQRWILEAGITLRTRSEVIQAEYVTYGDKKREVVSKTALIVNQQLAHTRSADHLHNETTRKKISATRLIQGKKHRESILITVNCEYCGTELHRLPCKVKIRNYCNRNHMMLYRHAQNRIRGK